MPAKSTMFRAVEPTWDNVANVIRQVGEEFEIPNKARAESLMSVGSVVPVDAPAPTPAPAE